MPNTSMNIRMDSEVKRQAEELFSEFGLTMTTAVNIFLRQAIREQSIPFELKLNVPNADTIAAIAEAEKISHDPNTKRYANFREVLTELEADA